MKNPLLLAFLGMSCLLVNGCDRVIDPDSQIGSGDSASAARNDVPSAAMPLVVGGDAVADHLDSSGRDWFRFHADSGKRYRIVFPTSPSHGYGGACQTDSTDPSMWSDRTISCALFDVGAGEDGATILAERTGSVFIQIVSHGVEDTGTYRIAVELDTAGIDAWEPDDDKSRATALPTDGTKQSHALPVGDHDWYRIAVQSGKGYMVTTQGGGVWRLALHQDSPYGDSVVLAQPSSLVSPTLGLFFNAARTGDVWVEVEGVCSSYTISAVVDTVDRDAFEPDDLPESASSIAVSGEPQAHRLRLQDVDYVRFHADSGATYTVSAAFRGEGGKLRVQVLDIDDTVWTRTVPGPDGIRIPVPQNAGFDVSSDDSTSFKAKWTRDFLVKIEGASTSVQGVSNLVHGAYELRIRKH